MDRCSKQKKKAEENLIIMQILMQINRKCRRCYKTSEDLVVVVL